MDAPHQPEFFSHQVTGARRFYNEAALDDDLRLKVVCGGCERTQADFKIDRKDFPYYSIEFVAKGRGTAVLQGRRFELSPGTVFSYGPKIDQVITGDGEQAMTKYFIDFVGSGARRMLDYGPSPGTALRVARGDEITRIFDDLINHGLSDSPYKSLISSSLLEYLFLRIAETRITGKTELDKALATYQNCRQHIKDNFLNLHSLQDVAEACRINNAYLCRLFKRFDTQSPYRYLTSLKMAFAAERLADPAVQVKAIAYELGYDDPFHFSRAFKNVFGISPQSFRALRQ